jgi:hypothetical protein
MNGRGIRAARNASAGAVAAIAAWSSYSHMVHVALGYGERPQVAYALPVSVDGMLVVASVVMVDDKRRVHRVRPIARLAFSAGMVASIAANIAAAHPSIGARIVDAWPAVALLLVVEMLARPPAPAAQEVPPVPAAGSQPPTEVVPQPPHPQVPSQLPPPVVLPPGNIPRPAAAEPHQPADVTAARQPYPAGFGQAGSPTHTAAPSVPHVHEQTETQFVPAPTVPTARQPAGNVPPAARGVAPHADGEVPPLHQVPPPATTDAEVPAEVDPPQRGSSTQSKRRNQTADTGTTRRRTSHHGSTGSGARRPTAATLQLARQIIDAEPDLPRTQVAARLGVSTRRLREVLATAGQPG